MEVAGKTYSRVIFTVPSPSGGIHNSVLNDALVFDAGRFCSEIIEVASGWWTASAAAPNVAKNADSLLQSRPGGLSPYIVGMPVIA